VERRPTAPRKDHTVSELPEKGPEGNCRARIKPGMTVLVVTKQDQATGRLTMGVVKRILTKSRVHPHGIKVMLGNGIVGRVKQIIEPERGP
jgi:uncharacterized repeat protein (TIGR03833 family)